MMVKEGIGRVSRNARYVFPWALSLVRRTDALTERMPWIVYSARDRIASSLRASSRVFEYGSGGSTLWFADRCFRVVSVEHNAAWCERIQRLLRDARSTNVDLRLVKPSARYDGSIATRYVSDDPEWSGCSFEPYVSVIEEYPDDFFDLVLVDGRARADCLEPGWTKLRVGGLLVLDDSDRERYQESMKRVPTNNREDHHGLVAFSRKFGCTTIWRKT